MLNVNAIPESEKLAFIITLFQSDPRPGIAIAIRSCQAQNLDHVATVKVLLNIANNLSDEHGVIKLAATSLASTPSASSSAKTGYCYKFQKNNCSKEESCQYRHVIDPDFKSRRPAAPTGKAKPAVKSVFKPPKPPLGKVPKLPFSSNLSTSHQQLVGPPSGAVTALSPDGYSNRQQTIIKALIASTASPTFTSVTVINATAPPEPEPD